MLSRSRIADAAVGEAKGDGDAGQSLLLLFAVLGRCADAGRDADAAVLLMVA